MESSAMNKGSYGLPRESFAAPHPGWLQEETNDRALMRTKLVNDIDDLRRRMAETFLKEASFTADPVILISRQLDVKINEYMKQMNIKRKQAR